MAYSMKTREQALDYCSRGYTDERVSEMMDVSKQTIGNWKKLLFTTGSLAKKKKRSYGKPYKYKPEKIIELLDQSRSTQAAPSVDDIVKRLKKTKKKKE